MMTQIISFQRRNSGMLTPQEKNKLNLNFALLYGISIVPFGVLPYYLWYRLRNPPKINRGKLSMKKLLIFPTAAIALCGCGYY